MTISTHQVLHQLRSVSADRLDCLEDVHLPVLDDLLDAGVSSAVDSGPPDAVLADHHHGAVVCPLPPPLHHVHQLHQGVGGGGHLVPLGPTHQLEQLAGLGRSLHSSHQLSERHNLLVDLEYPGSKSGQSKMIDRHQSIKPIVLVLNVTL